MPHLPTRDGVGEGAARADGGDTRPQTFWMALARTGRSFPIRSLPFATAHRTAPVATSSRSLRSRALALHRAGEQPARLGQALVSEQHRGPLLETHVDIAHSVAKERTHPVETQRLRHQRLDAERAERLLTAHDPGQPPELLLVVVGRLVDPVPAIPAVPVRLLQPVPRQEPQRSASSPMTNPSDEPPPASGRASHDEPTSPRSNPHPPPRLALRP